MKLVSKEIIAFVFAWFFFSVSWFLCCKLVETYLVSSNTAFIMLLGVLSYFISDRLSGKVLCNLLAAIENNTEENI